MRVVVTEFITLDGVIEDPGPDGPFEYAGWSMPYWGDDLGAFKFAELQAADAHLLGRVTYEGFAKAWPSRTDQQGFAEMMNSLPKYVVSTTLATVEWNNSHLIKENVAVEIKKLKQQPGRDMLVAGSSVLVQTLVKERLVDEFRLLVYPTVLGKGKRLFTEGTTAKLKLIESKSFNTGVVLLRYELAA